MFGINEILNKFFLKKSLTVEEKFKILHSKIINPNIVVYLMEKLNNLHIEVLGKYNGSLFELMQKGKLEGWCWQTTESAIVFLNDDDYIERGNLYFDERTPEYYHSWICFKFDGIEYVLDPCLNLLCKKSDYSKIFEITIKGKVSAKEVKEEMFNQITATKKEDNTEIYKTSKSFMKSFIGGQYEKYLDKTNNEIILDGPEDVNTPLYRNGAGYKTKIENDKIKKLTVHYYYMDC